MLRFLGLFFLAVEALSAANLGCMHEFSPTPEACEKFGFQAGPSRICGGVTENTFYNLSGLPDIERLDDQVVETGDVITNVFENGEKVIGYAACQDIGDKRGYTCGYVGFTTGTNDAESIIKNYTTIKPNNSLAKYLDRLRALSRLDFCDMDGRSNTVGLESFCDAWLTEACVDYIFSDMQRAWARTHYFLPSARFAAAAGVTSPLGQIVFYDTIIEHGYQVLEPDINIVRILELTGARGEEETEQEYLTRFLTTRRQMQCCYPDAVWPLSATRSADLQTLVDDFETNKYLNVSLRLPFFGVTIEQREDIYMDIKRCLFHNNEVGTQEPQK